MSGDRIFLDVENDLPPVPEPEPGTYIEIPLSLLYELADDSPLKGLKSVQEKLADLFGPKEKTDEDTQPE